MVRNQPPLGGARACAVKRGSNGTSKRGQRGVKEGSKRSKRGQKVVKVCALATAQPTIKMGSKRVQ